MFDAAPANSKKTGRRFGLRRAVDRVLRNFVLEGSLTLRAAACFRTLVSASWTTR